MRALLRSKQTGFYCRHPEGWTPDPGLAFDFELGTRAIQHAYDFRLKNVEIVFSFSDDQHDLTVPIADRSTRPLERPRALICRDGKFVQVM